MGSWQYLYCIVEGSVLPSGAYRGLEGAPVQSVAYRSISAVVSALPRPHVPAGVRNVVIHERLVEEVMARQAVLPVRFGTVLRDTAGVKLALSQRYRTFLEDLYLVRGKVELGVRILAPPEAPDLAESPGGKGEFSGPGGRYLMERLQWYARARAMGEQFRGRVQLIDAQLTGRAEARRVSPTITENTAMSAAYLVWEHRIAEFKREIEAQRLQYPDLRFLLTGPWPAYSFVTSVEAEVTALAALG